MIIDGKTIARELQEELRGVVAKFPIPPTLAIIVVGENPVIEQFVRIKQRVGNEIGVRMYIHRYPETISGVELHEHVVQIGAQHDVHGLIVQLPLPAHIDAGAILAVVPTVKDVDMLSRESVALFGQWKTKMLPPVAGAVQEILERTKTPVLQKEVLILGYGRLVGIPVSILLRHRGAHVTVIDQEIEHLSEHMKEADIIISGVGKPGIIVPSILHHGVVLIDAGTSESGGKVVGDADARCSEVASVFTPVPGGIGPIAVVMIFKNLCIAYQEQFHS